MAKQRIVGLVTPRYAPAIGGVERHVEAVAIGMARLGVQVEVITTDPTGQLPTIDEQDGVLIRRFPTLGHDSVYFIAPALGWWLMRNARRFAVLHVHSYHTFLALETAIASWWNKIPLIVTPHYHGTGHSPIRRVLHWPYRPLGRWVIYQAHQIICVSEVESNLLKRHFGKDIATLIAPNGVELRDMLAARPHKRAPGRVLILAVGRLEFYKQTARLIAALQYLPENYDVVIAGDGPARIALERQAQQLGVSPKILGQVSQADLLAWYRAADIFVTLSTRESFGMTVLEAAAAGAVVIASDIPAHREVATYIPSNRICFIDPNCTPSELARVLAKMPRIPELPDVKNWPLPAWSRTVQSILDCYKSVVGSDLLFTCSEVSG